MTAANDREGYAHKAEIDEQLSYAELEALSETKIEKSKDAIEKNLQSKQLSGKEFLFMKKTEKQSSANTKFYAHLT